MTEKADIFTQKYRWCTNK